MLLYRQLIRDSQLSQELLLRGKGRLITFFLSIFCFFFQSIAHFQGINMCTHQCEPQLKIFAANISPTSNTSLYSPNVFLFFPITVGMNYNFQKSFSPMQVQTLSLTHLLLFSFPFSTVFCGIKLPKSKFN